MLEQTVEREGYFSTGIAGLDYILCGGFLRSGSYLIQGNPGSGKTTMALQYLFERARRNETGLYISLTESRRDLERTCVAHGWNLDDIHVADLTRSAANFPNEGQYTVFHPSEVELGQTARAILEEVERANPQHVVFDGLSEMRLLSERPLRFRHQMLAMKTFLEDRGMTVLLLDDQTSPLGTLHPESLVHGNIVLERTMLGYGGSRRRLHVTKVRGSVFLDGYHDYDICQEGVVIHPRLVAGTTSRQTARTVIQSGIENLDRMVGGGLESGTTTLIMGPAGAGKSTIAMQFVVQHLLRGKRAATYVFDEVLDTLFERTEKLCHDGIRKFADSGALHVQQVNPAQLSPGAFTQEVRRAVDEGGAEIVVIDSLNGYISAMPDEKFLTTHLHELFSFLNNRGVLTITVMAQHGLVGSMTPDFDVSYLADTVFLLRYYELEGQINQAISVFKKRTGPHERSLRSLTIDCNGVSVNSQLTRIRGIMSGVPESLRGAESGSPN